MSKSASIGLIAGLYAAADARGASLAPPPATTALGALLGHITGGHIETIEQGTRSFQPMNINFGLFPPLASPPTRKPDGSRLRGNEKTVAKRQAISARALSISTAGCRIICASRLRREHPMRLPKDDAASLSARWSEGVLLKRDVFSTVERGRFRERDRRSRRGAAPARRGAMVVVRRWPGICSPVSAGATIAQGTQVGPELLWAGRRALVRGFIDGVALHLAKPHGDVAYFRSAKQALRRLHRAGICHNDLAKEQNWLRGTDGAAISPISSSPPASGRRSRLFRIAAYEDLRHLLKHKRSYVPEALTPKERKILARKSRSPASGW